MRNTNLNSQEDAVSAAVATVLMFGGVLAIIGMMLTSMVPLIEELEGGVEKHDLSAQFTHTAILANNLAGSGVPGDSAQSTIIPVHGNLHWDVRGGTWWSASWEDGVSLRLDDGLDYDNQMRVRTSPDELSTICFDDLRIGTRMPYRYTIPDGVEIIYVSSDDGLLSSVGPTSIAFIENGEKTVERKLMVDEVLKINVSQSPANSVLTSSHTVNVLAMRGGEGASEIRASDASVQDGTGRHWTVILPAGNSNVEVISSSSSIIRWWNYSDSGEERISSEGYTSWSKEFNTTSDEVLHISTSTSSRLMLSIGENHGRTSWPSTSGDLIGFEFVPPASEGRLRIYNPSSEQAIISWGVDGTTLEHDGAYTLAWPPTSGLSHITSTQPVEINWIRSSNQGLTLIPALDTWRSSGQQHQSGETSLNILQAVGPEVTWNSSGISDTYENGENAAVNGISVSPINSTGGPLRVIRSVGDYGMLDLMHDGEQRCVSVGITASGWIDIEIPWDNANGRSDGYIRNQQIEGLLPASFSLNLHNHGVDHSSTIATAWVLYSSRLSYGFESSIKGLEVAWESGAVVSNHPELEPRVILGPETRGGPGPRLAATIPAIEPAENSVVGASKFILDMELEMRTSLTSSTAYEVRRGWDSGYGVAISTWCTEDLDSSEDWLVFPGRLDLLQDYVGWVPDPTFDSSELIWHTGGEPIQFSLQVADIVVDLKED